MKAWRKVHSVLISSERLAVSSYEARWLYTLLLVAQDDEGRFPWTRTMVRNLTATTDWTYAEATGFKDELQDRGLISADGSFIVIRRGKEMNGQMRGDRDPFLYPNDGSDIPLTHRRLTTDIPAVDQRLTTDNPRASREDGDKTETREDETETESGADAPAPTVKASRTKTAPNVSDAFKAQMLARYQDLSGADAVLEEIAAALAHKNAAKWRDVELYVKRWLGRWADELQARHPSLVRNGHGPAPPSINDFPEPEPERGSQEWLAWSSRREAWWKANKPRQMARGPTR